MDSGDRDEFDDNYLPPTGPDKESVIRFQMQNQSVNKDSYRTAPKDGKFFKEESKDAAVR